MENAYFNDMNRKNVLNNVSYIVLSIETNIRNKISFITSEYQTKHSIGDNVTICVSVSEILCTNVKNEAKLCGW